MQIYSTDDSGKTLYRCRKCVREFPGHYIEGYTAICRQCGQAAELVTPPVKPVQDHSDVHSLRQCKKCRREYAADEILTEDYGRYAGICKQCFLTEMALRDDLKRK